MPHSAQHETEPIPQTWDIQARGVAKLYGDFPAVQNIDLDVPQGQFLGLLGRNGAGKTTLLKVLALLTRPSLGTLQVGGIDQDGDLSQVRRRMGLLGHNTFLYDELTAEENLLFYASLYSVPEAGRVTRQMLEQVGLAPFARERVRNFSRGMRQRLTIGRLFLHQPDVLLLDEPFTGLDDRASVLLDDLLREARRQGKTIVLCTHQLEQAVRLADRLLILDRGKVAYLGPNHPDRLAEMQQLYYQFAG